MNYLAQNIKYLRRKHQLTQQRLADQVAVKRALIGSYEEGRATPKIQVMQQLAQLFKLSLDELIGTDLEKTPSSLLPKSNGPGQILSVVVTPDNEERIPIVPVKAAAGYLSGYADPQYVGELPHFYMPIPELSRNRTYRVFQLNGDSMLPVAPGAYVFCEYLVDLDELKEGQTYVLITRDEGLVYKRVYIKENNELLLKSDNPEYEAYRIPISSVLELWRAKGVLSFELPLPEFPGTAHISTVLSEMKEEIRKLREG